MPKCDSIKLLYNFMEITLWDRCSPVNLPHMFKTPTPKNFSGWLRLLRRPLDYRKVNDRKHDLSK